MYYIKKENKMGLEKIESIITGNDEYKFFIETCTENRKQFIDFSIFSYENNFVVEKHSVPLNLNVDVKSWLIDLANGKCMKDSSNREVLLSLYGLYFDYNLPYGSFLQCRYYNFSKEQICNAILNAFEDKRVKKEKELLHDLKEVMIKHNFQITWEEFSRLHIGSREVDLSSDSNVGLEFKGEISFQTIDEKLEKVNSNKSSIEKVLEKYQFDDCVSESELGTEMSLVIPQGSSFKELFNEANTAYEKCASEEQKRLIANAISQGDFCKHVGFSDKIGAEKGLEIKGIPMVKGSTNKTLEQQVDKETSKLKFVEENLYGMSKLEIAAIAALKLLKSVSENVLVIPGEAKGDALEGKDSRAFGGGYVVLYFDGIGVYDWNDSVISSNIGCAGSKKR